MHEDDFIERINAGDSRAFKQLFDANVSLVYNVCLRMLNNRQDAEDVTQEVFFEAYKAIKQFRFESKLSTWLYRIAVNRSLNHRRSKKLQRWLALDFDAHEETVVNYSGSKEDGADVAMEKKDAERIVLDAINSLPDQQRIAILLHRYEELSYEEIAKIMGGTVASVESRLHRAKQTLAKKLLPLRKEL